MGQRERFLALALCALTAGCGFTPLETASTTPSSTVRGALVASSSTPAGTDASTTTTPPPPTTVRSTSVPLTTLAATTTVPVTAAPTTTTPATTLPPATLPPATVPPAAPPPAPQPFVGAPAGCDPNYTPCVPIASDVDCAGGKGNGPAYVRGPVTVIGDDIYDLDRDGDGLGCE